MTIQTIIRLPIALQRLGISRSTLYTLVKSKQFPRQISLGARAVGWLESDVEAYIAARVAASRPAQKGVAA